MGLSPNKGTPRNAGWGCERRGAPFGFPSERALTRVNTIRSKRVSSALPAHSRDLLFVRKRPSDAAPSAFWSGSIRPSGVFGLGQSSSPGLHEPRARAPSSAFAATSQGFSCTPSGVFRLPYWMKGRALKWLALAVHDKSTGRVFSAL